MDRLADLDLPVLVVGGVRDQCVPELARELAEGIPGARLEVLDAAHLPFAECRDDYVRLVGGFLAEHDD
jgi:pimeloyl-ACP methyl ester carboxylesterase